MAPTGEMTMANVEMLVEDLTKASDCASMARDDLLAALKNADAVQRLLILEFVEKSVDLRARIARLLGAVKSED